MHIPLSLHKLASKVKVREHLRHLRSGATTVVDAYEKDVDSNLKDELAQEDAAESTGPVEAPSETDSAEPTVPSVEELEEQIQQPVLKDKQAKELALWAAWKSSGDQGTLQKLLDAFAPVVNAHVAKFSGTRLPSAALKAEFQLQLVTALRNYDPSKGALNTHIFNYMQKGKRWIGENQNTARIPENRIWSIGKYKETLAKLQDDLGHDPTDKQLADELGWSLPEVGRMRSELRKDLVSQSFEEDPSTFSTSETEEVLRLFKFELVGKERDIYEYLTGDGKEYTSSTGDIASKMGIPSYEVSRVKSRIAAKLEKYVGGKR